MEILRLPNGRWIMSRDIFRGVIRIALILCIVVSCTETFYFMGELSKNSSNKPYRNPYYSTSTYNRSSTRYADNEKGYNGKQEFDETEMDEEDEFPY